MTSPWNFTIRERPVMARASRIAWNVASEPLPHRSTRSADGTWAQIFSASWASASVTPTPNSTPPSIASATRRNCGG